LIEKYSIKYHFKVLKILCFYRSIIHQLERDVELQELGDLRHQVDGEPLEAIIAFKFFRLKIEISFS
jgi:hypothetical protein